MRLARDREPRTACSLWRGEHGAAKSGGVSRWQAGTFRRGQHSTHPPAFSIRSSRIWRPVQLLDPPAVFYAAILRSMLRLQALLYVSSRSVVFIKCMLQSSLAIVRQRAHVLLRAIAPHRLCTAPTAAPRRVEAAPGNCVLTPSTRAIRSRCVGAHMQPLYLPCVGIETCQRVVFGAASAVASVSLSPEVFTASWPSRVARNCGCCTCSHASQLPRWLNELATLGALNVSPSLQYARGLTLTTKIGSLAKMVAQYIRAVARLQDCCSMAP